MATITLYLAYGIPIYLNWRNKRRRHGEYTTPETSPWDLGRWGTPVNLIAIVWTVFITVIFSIPPNEWPTMAIRLGSTSGVPFKNVNPARASLSWLPVTRW